MEPGGDDKDVEDDDVVARGARHRGQRRGRLWYHEIVVVVDERPIQARGLNDYDTHE